MAWLKGASHPAYLRAIASGVRSRQLGALTIGTIARAAIPSGHRKKGSSRQMERFGSTAATAASAERQRGKGLDP